MRYLTLLLFFITSVLSAQILIPNKYKERMDSMALVGFNRSMNGLNNKNLEFITFRPYQWVKLTIKGSFNMPMISKIYSSKECSDGSTEAIVGEDYLNFAMYDIRLKIYINKKIRILLRSVVMGIKTEKDLYTGGVIIKF